MHDPVSDHRGPPPAQNRRKIIKNDANCFVPEREREREKKLARTESLLKQLDRYRTLHLIIYEEFFLQNVLLRKEKIQLMSDGENVIVSWSYFDNLSVENKIIVTENE